MFFSACVGDSVAEWRYAVQSHAAWLGMRVTYIETHGFTCAQISSGGLAAPAVWEAENGVRAITSKPPLPGHLASAPHSEFLKPGSTNHVRLLFEPALLKLSVCTPIATPEQVVYLLRSGGVCLSNDIRLLRRMVDGTLDPVGVYSILQYGAIPAPATIFAGVHRAEPAHTTVIRTGGISPSVTTYVIGLPDRDEPDNISQALNESLEEIPQGAVLTFSGGIDSCFLASHFRERGRRDIELLNYVFGPQDAEAVHASRVASLLDMEFHQVQHDSSQVGTVMDQIGREYSYPFGDFASIPANLLGRAAAAMVGSSSVVVDGTGADGAFGTGSNLYQWERIYSTPASARRIAASAYAKTGLWKSATSLEHRARVIRRSVQMPMAQAMVAATNAFDGIVYDVPTDVGDRLARIFRTSIIDSAPSVDCHDQVSWLDLIHVCGGEYAAKSYDPLRLRGTQSVFPFLEPPMLAAAFAIPWDEKLLGGVSKAPLKSGLSGFLPADVVHRKKAGFVPPIDRWLTQEPLFSLAQDMAGRTGPLGDYLKPQYGDLVARAVRHGKVNQGAKNLIWAVTFTGLWLSQL